MPEYPRYESKVNLSRQRVAGQSTQDTSYKNIEQAGKVANQVQELNMKWMAADDTIKATSEANRRKVAIAQANTDAANDNSTDLDTLNKNHQKRTRELDRELNTDKPTFAFKSSTATNEANASYESFVGKAQMQNLYQKKKVDIGQTESLKLIASNVSIPTIDSLNKIKANLEDQVAAGIFDNKDAHVLLQKANDDLGKNRVSKDLYNATTVEEARAIKEGIRSGAYEAGGVTIEAKEKSTLMKSAEVTERRIITNNRFEDRVIREAKTHDLIQQANAGVLDPAELEEAFNNKEISNSTFNGLRDWTTSFVGPSAETDNATYHNLIQSLLVETDMEKARMSILNANSEGKLSRKDAEKMYNMHFGSSSNPSLAESMGKEKTGTDFDKMKADYDAEQESLKDKNNYLKAAYNIVAGFFGADKDEKITEAMRNVYTNALSGDGEAKDIPIEADKEVARQNLKKHPEWAKLPEKGLAGVDRFGNSVTVYPDGRVVAS